MSATLRPTRMCRRAETRECPVEKQRLHQEWRMHVASLYINDQWPMAGVEQRGYQGSQSWRQFRLVSLVKIDTAFGNASAQDSIPAT